MRDERGKMKEERGKMKVERGERKEEREILPRVSRNFEF
jgi:hypothetical protein